MELVKLKKNTKTNPQGSGDIVLFEPVLLHI